MSQRISGGRAGRAGLPERRVHATRPEPPEAHAAQRRTDPRPAAPRTVVTAQNVSQWIDALRRAPRDVLHLQLDLHEALPLGPLKSLLAALEALPELQSLDMQVIAQAAPTQSLSKQAQDCRYALAGSRICLRLSLGVRRHLRCQPDWGKFDELEWHGFFTSVDCDQVLGRSQPELSDNALAHLRSMALIACRNGEGPLLKALKTLCPSLHLRFTSALPTPEQTRLLLKRRIPLRIEARIEKPGELTALCRLLRHTRLHLTLLCLKVQTALDEKQARLLLSSLLQARHLQVLSLNIHRSVCVHWPEGIQDLPPTPQRLKTLTVNLAVFDRCHDLGARFIRACAPRLLNLQLYRCSDWPVLQDDGFASVLRASAGLTLRLDDFATPGEDELARLRQTLGNLLGRSHCIQTLRVTMTCTSVVQVPDWPLWVAMAEQCLPLQHLSVMLRFPERDIATRKQEWRWSSQALLKTIHGAYIDGVGEALMVAHTPLPKELREIVLAMRALSPHDCWLIAQASRQVRLAAFERRRLVQASRLMELARYGMLDAPTLNLLTGAALNWAEQSEALQHLLLDMQAEGVAEDQQALVRSRLAELSAGLAG